MHDRGGGTRLNNADPIVINAHPMVMGVFACNVSCEVLLRGVYALCGRACRPKRGTQGAVRKSTPSPAGTLQLSSGTASSHLLFGSTSEQKQDSPLPPNGPKTPSRSPNPSPRSLSCGAVLPPYRKQPPSGGGLSPPLGPMLKIPSTADAQRLCPRLV